MQHKKIIHSMPLCSRCTHNEVTSWIEENSGLREDVKKLIVQELKTIKLKPGECIVCKSGLIADTTSMNILEILEENKVDEKLKEEFIKDFCMQE